MDNSTIAVLGTNLTARGWAITFARAGYRIRLFNSVPGSSSEIARQLALTAGDLAENELLGTSTDTEVLERIEQHFQLASALAGASYIQDNTEGLPAKKAIFELLDRLAAPEAVRASSNVGILTSEFAEHLAHRGRVLLVHPINPALLPIVEIAANPWTEVEVLDRTFALMREIGLQPLRLSEFKGLIIDRLAGALLHEAFRLVAAGLATVDDVDACVAGGLARRWVIAGPFETMDINVPGGVVDYVRGAEPMMRAIFDNSQNRAVDWSGELAAEVERQRRKDLPADKICARLEWRDRQLARLAKAKDDWLRRS